MPLKPTLRVDDYQYPLPDEKIAREPLPRGHSKLLLYRKGELAQSRYRQLGEHLPQGARLIFNETKVVQARLLFPLQEKAIIEVFCLEPYRQMSVEEAMQQRPPLTLNCLVGKAKKWKDHPLTLPLQGGTLTAQKRSRTEGIFQVEFNWDTEQTFAEVLAELGKTPLPPYLKRPATAADVKNYQTVYARTAGSVAAPTAGLHFDAELLQELENKGFTRSNLVLHVGAGTFKPMAGEEVAQHHMHGEEFAVDQHFIAEILTALQAQKPLIPVGTTSLRALESMYWLGSLCYHNLLEHWQVPQWIGFEHPFDPPSPLLAFTALRQKLQSLQQERLIARTELMIAPGYHHRLIHGLLTNFHQPGSTLLLLVASLIGEHWRDVYNYALAHDFRFLSYGDGCYLEPGFFETKD